MRLNRWGSGRAVSASCVLLAMLLAASALLLKTGTLPSAAASRRPNSPALASEAKSVTATTRQIRSAYGRLPLMFEANQGQSDQQVKFLARGTGYSLFLTSQHAVLVLQHSNSAATRHSAATSVVRMELAGANPQPDISGAGELPGKSNYLIGNDPAKWHRNIPQFVRVRYQGVYPGIDLTYYGNQGKLEYDFQVAPGADPARIALRFPGSKKLQFDANGNLLLPLAEGSLRLEAPHVYQMTGTEREAIPARFVVHDGEVRFALGGYDHSRDLVIDPVLVYSTYLGGSGAESCSAITGAAFTPGCPAIAVDSGANAYIAGSSTSTNFPNPSGTSPALKGVANVFVAKLNNTGSALLFSTYIGGSGTDTAAGVGVDSGFDVLLTGTTNSPNFPANGSFQPAPKTAGNHVFVTKLDPSASSVLYSTYLSGSGTDSASGLALDPQGKAYVTGTTTSTDFPTSVGAFQTASKATNQFFISKIDPTLTGTASLVYSTYFGGSNPSSGVAVGGGIAVDSSSDVYITGGTNFLDLPIQNAAQGCLDTPTTTSTTPTSNCSTLVTATDAFVVKLNPAAASGAQLLYSTYVGGSGNDIGYGIAVDSGGVAYITGSTNSTDFIFPSGTQPLQRCPNVPNFTLTSTTTPTCPASTGNTDTFVAKISSFTPPATGSTTTTSVSLLYFSYLGGSGNDAGISIAVDSVQGARLTGWTDSTDFPVQNAIQAASGGGRDAFVANIDTTMTAVCTPSAATHCPSYSSYFGGAGTDMGTSVAIDSQDSTYLAGETASSTGFPLLNPLQGALNGPSDAFLSKLGPIVNLTMTASASPTPVGVGNQVTFTYAITNVGDTTNAVTFTDNFGSSSPNATFVSATASPGSCGTQVSGGTVQCNIGTLNTTPSGTTGATVSVILTPNPTSTTQGALPPLGNSGTVSVAGSTFQVSASASATVNNFAVSVAPATTTVIAGQPASYTVTITPMPSGATIPDSVSLSVSGLPSGGSQTFSTSPIPNLNQGPVTSVMTVNTTARVTTTVHLWEKPAPLYAVWLPISGLAFVGIGGTMSRRRRVLLALAAGVFFTLILLQPACGTRAPTTTTTGTPAGTYTLTLTATSGSATRNATAQLVVQ